MAETTTLKALREAIAGQLGLLWQVTIDGDTDPVFAIPSLSDKAPDLERSRDTFLYQSGEWRRIVSVDGSYNVTVTRTSSITTGAAQIYSLLDPDEFNGAINEALRELWHIDVDSITLVADTYSYSLPSWIQTKGQVVDLKWRDLELLTTRPQEDSVKSYRLIEDVNSLSVFINEALRNVTTYDLRVYARRNYSTLASDASTTTCPYPLIFACGMVKVLQRIFNKYGKAMNQLFGPRMVVAEGEMAKAKKDWLPPLGTREIVEEELWQGPDGNPYFDNPTW